VGDSTRPLQILLVEDDEDWADVLHEALLGETQSLSHLSHPGFRVTQVDSWHAAQARLEKESFDGLLLDLSLPDAEGHELVEFAHAHAPNLPIVILSGRGDDAAAVEAVQRGAQEYLVKSEFHPSVLRRTLRYAIERHRFLQETQRRQIEMRDEFLSHVSHELRTPLTAIGQFVSILLDGLAGELAQEQRDYLKIIQRNSLQLRAMVEDLLDVTRAESGKLRVELWPVAPQAVIDDVTESLASAAVQRRVTLEAAHREALPDVFADELRARQVLANLVANAIKFTPGGGRVHVDAHVVAAGKQIEFEVRDTGPGIAKDRRERIFRRLTQEPQYCEGSRKGLGLGLFISRQLVALMNGDMGVESALGKGSRFWFRLPAYSLERLLLPILSQDLASPTALLTVHVLADDTTAEVPQGSDEALTLLRQRVRDLVTLDRDLVLPRMRQTDPPGGGGLIHVVARVDAEGAESMRARVERGIARFTPLQGYGLNARVTAHPLAEPREAGSAEALAEYVARQVSELIGA